MSDDEDVRQEFQQILKETLNTCYPFWQIRNSKDRPYELPDAETLQAWIEGTQRPQAKTFKGFLEKSVFPEEIKRRLSLLYPQLQRRKSLPDNPPEIQSESPNEKRKSKPRKTFSLVISICLVVMGTVILFIAIQIVRQTETTTWCTARASNTESNGEVSLLYFDAAVPLKNFNEIQFYIYFDSNQYVSEQMLSSRKLDVTNRRWEFTISPEWAQDHPEWHDPRMWHVEYAC